MGKLEDCSFVLQGPIQRKPENLLRQLEILDKTEAEIIVSGWSGCDESILKDYIRRSRIKLIKSFPPPLPYFGIENNLPLQVQSTRKGLLLATRRLAIKFRSDELFSNIDPIVEAIRNNPTKLVSSNIFFIPPERGASHTYLHTGNHFYGGTQTSLFNMFNRAWDHLARFNDYGLSIEGYLCWNFLQANVGDFKLTYETSLDLMKKHTIPVDINLCGCYNWCVSGKYHSDDHYLFNNGFNKSIKSIEELP